eukprot:5423430-Pleurochrysis_carterae.AAC.2
MRSGWAPRSRDHRYPPPLSTPWALGCGPSEGLSYGICRRASCATCRAQASKRQHAIHREVPHNIQRRPASPAQNASSAATIVTMCVGLDAIARVVLVSAGTPAPCASTWHAETGTTATETEVL